MLLKLNLLLVFLLIWTYPSNAQAELNDWKLVATKDNIQVFTRTPKHSDFKEIRITAIFDATLEKIMNALDDAESYKAWVYKCIVSKKVEILNELEFYYYIESDLPFPLTNRDLVVHSTKWKEKDKNIVHYFSSAKNKVVPVKEGIVRMTEYDSSWTITEIEKNKLNIEYQCSANPSGSLPAWLVNMAVTTGPLKTMQSLEKYIKN